MPPKNKPSAESLKQKSLMSWFSKGPGASVHPPHSNQNLSTPSCQAGSSKPARDIPPPSSSPESVRSMGTERDDIPPLNIGKGKRIPSVDMVSSGDGSTPPTSDLVDVDMLSHDEQEDGMDQEMQVRKTKRKLVIDSEEEDFDIRRSGQRKSSYRIPGGEVAPPKKPRLIDIPSSDEEQNNVTAAFSRRLTHFKRANIKSSQSSSAKHDDDDFVLPSDHDEDDSRSIKSSRSTASRRSHASSSEAEGDDFLVDDEEEETVGKKKAFSSKKGKSKPSAVANGVGSSYAGCPTGSSFLTAAERREQGKKNDKKAAEEPYAFLLDVRDKDGRRPGDPLYDPRTLFVPAKAWKDFTPFEKQFWEIKQNHYDTILFFQKGKFFELYEDDARIGHQVFDLKLTTRVKMSMVGVPEMSFNYWAAKFLGKGYKVGRVEQSETALGAEMRLAATKSKGKAGDDQGKEKIVRRELNKVYTNGTLVDPELLTDDHAGHCVAIFEDDEETPDGAKKFGVCVLDCSTSQFNLSSLDDDVCRTRLETLMRQIRPKELLFKKGTLSVSTTRLLKTVLPAACLWTGLRTVEGFDYQQTIEELRRLYPLQEDTEMDYDADCILPSSVPEPIREMVDSKLAIQSLGSMIWYLRQLNIDKDILSMKNFNVYDPMMKGQGLRLDGQSLAHLEVLVNNEGTDDGSLLKLICKCITPFGKRLFRIWLCMPLCDIPAINTRLDAVQDIMRNPVFEAEFAAVAKGLPDLERIVSRVHAKNCKVKDFLKLLTAFKKLSRGLTKLAEEAASFESKTILGLLRGAPDLSSNIKHVESLFVPAAEKADELIPQAGKDEDYDQVMTEIKGLEDELEMDLQDLKKTLKIPLSYWHSAQGNKEIYLVETAVKEKVPKEWTKASGTKAKSRYVVGSLQRKVRQLKEARETRNSVIKSFKNRLFDEFDADTATWLRAIRVFAELDCLFSLAKASIALGEPTCRPEFVEGDSALVDFEELRHPTLCLSTSLKSFIPNNVKLGGDVAKITLLTGPNMAGKSTVMRMTATGVILAQLGMLVPAAHARLSPIDSIITRMGAYDNMFSNASTFKVELDECCKILREATPKSLVILDELGRGTSTFDGMAIAGAVLHQLATHTLPLAFFATHYGSLTDDYGYHPNIRNMHMSTIVDDEKRDIVFLFKLVEGVATSSFGTHVANLAGVPLEVVERAEVVSRNFAQQFKERLSTKRKQDSASRMPLPARADFSFLYKIATGQLQLPDNELRRKEILKRMKDTVRVYPLLHIPYMLQVHTPNET
ncbi:hypothetical protein AMATHDRAFT_80735 [Amanita thiersii Skay4041]|uniref:DNA mismatch repair protein n=1 Tax=Amanita thiersii Skay4041 TaxID=703135 RepID=A0A2A9NSD1_9AGAR|nr:hypothetical protein AMATHDRAFT_80735 [Amanita thiersii Skay4041]